MVMKRGWVWALAWKGEREGEREREKERERERKAQWVAAVHGVVKGERLECAER